MSVMQRPNALLIAVEPFRPTVQDGSLPDGKVTVIELARRNCRSKVWMALRSSDHSTVFSLPVPCTDQGESSPTCTTTGIVDPAGMFQVGLRAWKTTTSLPWGKRIEKLRLSVGLVLP